MKELRKVCNLVSKMTRRNILTSPALQKICSANEIQGDSKENSDLRNG